MTLDGSAKDDRQKANPRPAVCNLSAAGKQAHPRFIKVLIDARTERIFGASPLCIEGDEIVHSLLDVMACWPSYRVM